MGNASARIVGVGRCLLVACLVSAGAAQADPPTVSHIYPPGGQRGTAVKFHVGGCALHGAAWFNMRAAGLVAGDRIVEVPTRWFEGPLLTKPASQGGENYPRDHAGEVTIAADAPLGEASWQVWTSQGATAGRTFVIGHLPEVLEDEIDGRPLPQQVTLPVTANGRIFPREDVDIWSFSAVAGQSITCDVSASRIGSPLDSHIEIRGPAGELIAENDDRAGATDSLLRFTPMVSGTYQIHIRDTEFRGLQDYVYRLTITDGPVVDHVFPLGGRAGETVQFRLFGQSVPGAPVALKLPAVARGLTAISFTVDGQLSNPVLVDVSDLPEATEVSGTAAADKSLPNLELPVRINGCIGAAGEVDRWTFRASAGQIVECELLSARLGSRLDGVINISDAQGKSLLQAGSTPDAPVEPMGSFTIPSDGLYTLEVRDVFPSRGGDDFAYRALLRVAPAADYRLKLAADALTVLRGGQAKLKVTAERTGGFAGEIKLQLGGLPEGVTITGDTIAADKSETELVLKADAKAKVQGQFITIDGTAMRGEEPLVRRAAFAVPPPAAPREALLLAVAMPTPFQIDGGSDIQFPYGARGTIYRRKFAVIRNGYTGPLTVRLADRQVRHLQGISGPVMEVGPDVDEFEYPLRISTFLETNRTSRVIVVAVGEVTDEEGTKHKVSTSSAQGNNMITVFTSPSPLNLQVERSSLLATPGTTRELRVALSRGTLSPAPLTVELILPDHFADLAAESFVIPADETSGVLRIRFGARPGPLTMPVILRATTRHDGDPVVAETKINLVPPPSSASKFETVEPEKPRP